jgi:hypothetical protein
MDVADFFVFQRLAAARAVSVNNCKRSQLLLIYMIPIAFYYKDIGSGRWDEPRYAAI